MNTPIELEETSTFSKWYELLERILVELLFVRNSQSGGKPMTDSSIELYAWLTWVLAMLATPFVVLASELAIKKMNRGCEKTPTEE